MKSVINDTYLTNFLVSACWEKRREVVHNGERERENGRGNTVCGSTETVNIYGIARR